MSQPSGQQVLGQLLSELGTVLKVEDLIQALGVRRQAWTQREKRLVGPLGMEKEHCNLVRMQLTAWPTK